jgi:predicted transcriptional regulator YdeE
MLSVFKKRILQPSPPKIIDLSEPINIVGLSIKTNSKNVYKDISALGIKFNSLKNELTIPHRKEPWGFVAISKEFNPQTKSWTYIIGDVVNKFSNIPNEFMTYEIPPIKYAVFTIQPKNRYVWAWTINQKKNYVYRQWLPKSEFEPAGIIDDFEYHDERIFRERDPEIDLYIAIKLK